MKYPVRCTHCLTQLINLKKYANAHYHFEGTDCYIEIDDIAERLLIEDIEMYMKAAYKYLRKLTEQTEKEI